MYRTVISSSLGAKIQSLLVNRPVAQSLPRGACRLFVADLPWGIDDIALREAFEDFGQIVETNVVFDETGRSKGFGFVTFRKQDEATEALETMDGKDVYGRRIRVTFASSQGDKVRAQKRTKIFVDVLQTLPRSTNSDDAQPKNHELKKIAAS